MIHQSPLTNDGGAVSNQRNPENSAEPSRVTLPHPLSVLGPNKPCVPAPVIGN